MNMDEYRRRLLELERQLVSRIEREKTAARGVVGQTQTDVGDIGDASMVDEVRDEQLTEAEMAWTTLTQVREALQRIEGGTFGTCVVDGEPIEEKRLQAMPWTPYCLKHQESLEALRPPKLPTL